MNFALQLVQLPRLSNYRNPDSHPNPDTNQTNTHPDPTLPAVVKIFDGHCQESGDGHYKMMFKGKAEGDDNPGTAEQRINRCSEACLSKKTPVKGSWTGFVAKGFIVITDSKNDYAGRCFCSSLPSFTCKRPNEGSKIQYVRYDWGM